MEWIIIAGIVLLGLICFFCAFIVAIDNEMGALFMALLGGLFFVLAFEVYDKEIVGSEPHCLHMYENDPMIGEFVEEHRPDHDWVVGVDGLVYAQVCSESLGKGSK